MDNVKKFEDFLDRIQEILDNAKKQGHIIVRIEDLENAFPELVELEDERIRKAQLDYWRSVGGKEWHGVPVQEAIVWLEKQNHDGKKWIYEDVYLKEKEQLIQDGIDEVLENPQKYGLEKQGEQKPKWTEEDECYKEECISAVATKDGWSFEEKRKTKHWLESLKLRLQ